MVDTLLVISFEELCQVERLNQEMIVEVIDYGIAEPVSGDDKNDWMFDTSSVRWVKKAITLYDQLELDWVAIAMIVELLKQKEKLTEENEYLHRRLTRF
ncbi:Chaperone modulatory protein CbpM [Alteromonas sp. 38]|uniref:chaperone modulator CbpM n=1 Tax=Alteromonas TaxID=226 RepID=UPI0012EF07E5|nr:MULTISPECIES: chaperone modulator CbpM [Alteromonas]CAD5263839.1 Chaperone modulatory protein CbpM [Alteromonas sp. 154]VXC18291.1 Chaperone modulatory protein CbpM [Alteromonas sp. 38]